MRYPWRSMPLLELGVISVLTFAAQVTCGFQSLDHHCEHWSRVARAILKGETRKNSLEDAFYAISILQNCEEDLGEDDHIWCGLAAAGMHGSGGIKDIYYGFEVAEAYGCGIPEHLGRLANDFVDEAIAGSKLEGLYYGTFILAKKSSPPLEIIKKVVVLVESSGKVASDDSPESPPTEDFSYMAAELLSFLSDFISRGDSHYNEIIASLQSISSLLPSNADETSNDSVVDPTLIAPLLSSRTSYFELFPKISRSRLRVILDELLSHCDCGNDISCANRSIRSFRVIKGLPESLLFLQFHPSTIKSSESTAKKIMISLSNVAGLQASEDTKITLSGLRKFGSKSESFADHVKSSVLEPRERGYWALSPASPLKPGVYEYEFTLNLENSDEVEVIRSTLTVSGHTTVVRSSIKIGNKEQSKVDEIKVSSNELISCEFALKGDIITPRQTALRIMHSGETQSVHIPVKSHAGPDADRYTVSFKMADFAEDLLHTSGLYVLDLFIGDPLLEGISLQVATIRTEFQLPKVIDLAIYTKPLLHESDTALFALPEKHYTLRNQERRAPFQIGVLFSFVVIYLLVSFISVISQTGNKKLHTAGKSFWTVTYHLSIGSILTLFFLYWIQLTMKVTLTTLFPMLLFLYFSERKALKELIS